MYLVTFGAADLSLPAFCSRCYRAQLGEGEAKCARSRCLENSLGGRSPFTGSLFQSEALPLAFGMSSCDDLFYLDIDYSSDRDGCYESVGSTVNWENAYFLNGIEDVGSAVVYGTNEIVDDHVRYVRAW